MLKEVLQNTNQFLVGDPDGSGPFLAVELSLDQDED